MLRSLVISQEIWTFVRSFSRSRDDCEPIAKSLVFVMDCIDVTFWVSRKGTEES